MGQKVRKKAGLKWKSTNFTKNAEQRTNLERYVINTIFISTKTPLQ